MTEKAGAILLDIPWDPKAWSEKGKGRHPSAYYETMLKEEIAALPVRDYAAEHCWVFFWIIDQFFVIGAQIEIFKAWGCVPSSIAFVWVKTSKRLGKQLPLFLIDDNKEHPFGQGHTTRKNCEYCLLAKFGKPPILSKRVPQVIYAPRRANSQKPDEQYGLIERLVRGPYVEFFARQRRPGWQQVFSNEADSGPGKRRWSSAVRGSALAELVARYGDNQ
jgi:N6-adenosine-specific RNA methylase IME4